VQQALMKQIISVFETMYLEILNDNMVGYADISARDMLDHHFETYRNITAVGLEINFEYMRRAWDPQQPVESPTFLKQGVSSLATRNKSTLGMPENCDRSLHGRMLMVEYLDPIQIQLCSSSPSTQANAGRIRCHSWIPLRKYHRCPQ
jgi:hypothetical protein